MTTPRRRATDVTADAIEQRLDGIERKLVEIEQDLITVKNQSIVDHRLTLKEVAPMIVAVAVAVGLYYGLQAKLDQVATSVQAIAKQMQSQADEIRAYERRLDRIESGNGKHTP